LITPRPVRVQTRSSDVWTCRVCMFDNEAGDRVCASCDRSRYAK
jgi:hypothetical protein